MTIITVSADVAAQAAESLLQANADRLVQRDVQLCLSSMVQTLALAGNANGAGRGVCDLIEQAQELCTPGLDYEEPARQAGWTAFGSEWHRAATTEEIAQWAEDGAAGDTQCADGAEAACDLDGLDPYEWEVFEHWAVSTWLAEKLQEAGERVDTDFAGLNVWARTTTGQAISMDGVIRKITAELHADAPAA